MNNAPRNNGNRRPNGSNVNTASNIVLFLLQLQTSVKVYHWVTRSYATHKETGALYDKIIDLADAIVEQYMGVYGRPRMAANASIAVPNMTKGAMKQLLHDGIAYLSKRMPPDSHIRNLCDELAGEMAKALYLMTMR